MVFSRPTGRIEPGILYVVLFNVVYGLTLWDGLRGYCAVFAELRNVFRS